MRVLVTRPEPGASNTADVLRARGLEPMLMPLTRTVELTPGKSDLSAARSAAYAVTSANAVRAWQSLGIDEDSLGHPVYAVGERTGAMAAQAGFKDVRTGDGDGAQLAEKILSDIGNGALSVTERAPLVYVAGKLRHGQFESVLDRESVPLRTVETYEIVQISYSTDFIEALFQDDPPRVVLFYSAVAAGRFFHVLNTTLNLNVLNNCTFFCLSKNVAEEIPVEFEERAAVAAVPDEAHLMALFDDCDIQL
ncbi:uroporphyrinogen-III synthase [Nitratireductor sp. XY-223]|uniref:uroporphyrinogen-III synthase n=1 Tax=Nitratireductor sp. XY-223 TaxID=2561926 RepID=UPI0010AB25DF|nr:uroporphyrinogen-III synthase [Nitratireductor sp. XY-223]